MFIAVIIFIFLISFMLAMWQVARAQKPKAIARMRRRILPGNNISPLIDATAASDDRRLRALLKKGASPDTRNETGTPAIILAVRRDAIECVRTLIRAGADVNAMDRAGNTAMFFVASVPIYLELLKAGAVVSAINADSRTPLFYIQQPDVLEKMMQVGADVHHADTSGKTALFFARTAPVAECLIKQGAYVNHTDDKGRTPIFYAQKEEIAAVLIQNGANLLHRDKAQRCIPILSEMDGVMTGLADTCANAAHFLQNQTELTKAVSQRDIKQVRRILRCGANPNLYENQGLTDIVDYQRYGTRMNMMSIAIQNNAPEIVRALAEAGADVNETNLGYSPLMRAAKLGKYACFDMLLQFGADIHKEFYLDEVCRAFSEILDYQYCRILKKALASGAEATQEVREAIKLTKNADFIRVLLEHDRKPSVDDLTNALKIGNTDAWMWQVDNGVKIDTETVFIAIEHERHDFIEYILSKGIMPRKSWLSKAMECKSDNCIQLISKFII